MHWIRREALISLIPISLLVTAFMFLYLGVPPLLPLRNGSDWPHVALVSVSPGTTPDVRSSVPGLLHTSICVLQCLLLVELVRLMWLVQKVMTPYKFILTLAYQVALTIDTFRLWGRDWFVWILYQLNFGNLCYSAAPCYPRSEALPWGSLLLLVGLLIVTAQERLSGWASKASRPPANGNPESGL
jgi:hypothetical protein